MDHVAIMRKSWGFIEKIANGQKTIESRWYKVRHIPWGKISPGDSIYFKNSGEPIALRAEVEKVLYFSDLTPKRVQTILEQYCKEIGIDEPDIPKYLEMFKNKSYCILIYLKDAQHIQPFEINKQRFGKMSSWISIESVAQIKM